VPAKGELSNEADASSCAALSAVPTTISAGVAQVTVGVAFATVRLYVPVELWSSESPM
jgi:hypothetical protein